MLSHCWIDIKIILLGEIVLNVQIFGKKKCFDTKKAERFFKERNIINELDKKECLLLAKEVEEKVSLKTKLQDSLLILYKMSASMELIFMIKSKLKKYK